MSRSPREGRAGVRHTPKRSNTLSEVSMYVIMSAEHDSTRVFSRFFRSQLVRVGKLGLYNTHASLQTCT